MGELRFERGLGAPGWEWCGCEWLVSERYTFRCGCGQDHERVYRDAVIHWRGGHWWLACAFRLLAEKKA